MYVCHCLHHLILNFAMYITNIYNKLWIIHPNIKYSKCFITTKEIARISYDKTINIIYFPSSKKALNHSMCVYTQKKNCGIPHLNTEKTPSSVHWNHINHLTMDNKNIKHPTSSILFSSGFFPLNFSLFLAFYSVYMNVGTVRYAHIYLYITR